MYVLDWITYYKCKPTCLNTSVVRLNQFWPQSTTSNSYTHWQAWKQTHCYFFQLRRSCWQQEKIRTNTDKCTTHAWRENLASTTLSTDEGLVTRQCYWSSTSQNFTFCYSVKIKKTGRYQIHREDRNPSNTLHFAKKKVFSCFAHCICYNKSVLHWKCTGKSPRSKKTPNWCSHNNHCSSLNTAIFCCWLQLADLTLYTRPKWTSFSCKNQWELTVWNTNQVSPFIFAHSAH